VPIYEYECDNCKEAFEVFLGINDPQVESCPNCNGKEVRKLISNCSFQLKGSGWYLTDYARKDKKDSPAKEDKNKTESKSKSSEKSTSTKDSGKAA
jgi:putative FmdB family regulatory protein